MTQRVPHVLPLGAPIDPLEVARKRRRLLFGALGGSTALVAVAVLITFLATRPPEPPAPPVAATHTTPVTPEPDPAPPPSETATASAPVAAAQTETQSEQHLSPRARRLRRLRARREHAGSARHAQTAAESRPVVVVPRRSGRDALSAFGI